VSLKIPYIRGSMDPPLTPSSYAPGLTRNFSRPVTCPVTRSVTRPVARPVACPVTRPATRSPSWNRKSPKPSRARPSAETPLPCPKLPWRPVPRHYGIKMTEITGRTRILPFKSSTNNRKFVKNSKIENSNLNLKIRKFKNSKI
jgi:hypothetical protein